MLEIQDLEVSFPANGTWIPVVRNMSLTVGRGEWIGLVGESGCGKSLTALATLRLVPAPGRIESGRVLWEGRDLLGLPEAEMRRIRGGTIGLVFQEPMSALNPVLTVGYQIVEAIRAHRSMSRGAARHAAAELLELVAIPEPRHRLRDYPHQLSGGQRQRVLIAMALAAKPDLLLADEPTTALDVTVQAQILELLERLRRELSLSVLFITHDLAVVAETCDRVAVMYAGEVVEEAGVTDLFRNPAHPYTRALLESVPRWNADEASVNERQGIPGRVPEPGSRPPGCAFHPRCRDAMQRCAEEEPTEVAPSLGRRVRCLLHQEGRALE